MPSDDPPSYADMLATPAEALEARFGTSPEEAARWARKLALTGSPAGIVQFGNMLLIGHGMAADPPAALRWFRIGAEAGDPECANMVGRCHELGMGTAVDPAEAARWFRLAADKNHAWALFNLGCLYLAGRGVPADRREALALFVHSARRGNAKAMNMLGRYCEEGWTGRRKIAAARRWYRRAAEGGCFRGLFHSGRFMLMDDNPERAAELFSQSVAIAPPDFCRDAGAMLIGHPAEAIRAVAFTALERACESGEAGDFHAFGKALALSTPLDENRKEQAILWLSCARKAGFADPEDHLGHLLDGQPLRQASLALSDAAGRITGAVKRVRSKGDGARYRRG